MSSQRENRPTHACQSLMLKERIALILLPGIVLGPTLCMPRLSILISPPPISSFFHRFSLKTVLIVPLFIDLPKK